MGNTGKGTDIRVGMLLQRDRFILTSFLKKKWSNAIIRFLCCKVNLGCHIGTVVTHSSPTSKVGGSNPRPYVGNMVAYQCSAVYSTEP